MKRSAPWLLAAMAWAVCLPGCGKKPAAAAKPEAPFKLDHPGVESALNTITLPAEAEAHLGLKTAAVELRSMRQRRVYGGDVVLPTGASIIVAAPVGGTLQAVSQSGAPEVGSRVGRDEPVFILLPLLSVERNVLTPAERMALAQTKMTLADLQITAAGQIEQAEVALDLAKTNLKREERLFNDGGAGTRRAVDTARAALAQAEKQLEAAQQREEMLRKIELDADGGDVTPIPIVSPRDGVVRTQQATVGQIVSVGTPLFEVMDCDPLWIKVPVYAGEVHAIETKRSASIEPLGDDGAAPQMAEPVPAPPTADPQAATVDLYYELPNADGALRPGQRVDVTVMLRGEQQSRVIPWSAVVHDIYGGQWVYEETAPHQYVRRRVQVPYIADNLAVLDSGPPEGANIVVEGVAELFGTEFGASH
ncbi:MAG TPA: efflux RND transporter periplasmic adaptor subunit [Pirellulales bacterium]|nr:efflux RND transporter periplasmic adaptor subunit [Pirellulales bacterium]